MDTPKIPYTYTANPYGGLETVTINSTTYTTGFGNRQVNYTTIWPYLPPHLAVVDASTPINAFSVSYVEELVKAIILARLDGAL